MFSKDKINFAEVVKWGIFAGVLEGAYIALAAILYANRQVVLALTEGIPHVAFFILITLIILSAIISTVIVFAHPIHEVMKGEFKDAMATIFITIGTLTLITVFVVFFYSQIYL